MLPVGSKGRLVVGLFGVFVMVWLFYLFLLLVLPQGALAGCIALGSCIIVYFLYRWQVKPPQYHHQLSEIRALALLAPLTRGAFLSFGGYSMEPDALLQIVHHIQTRKLEAIVECGSGVSTIIIGNLLRQNQKGHLFSVEDDKNWFDFVSGLLTQQDLGRWVTLVYAPLQEYGWTDTGAAWYDIGKLQVAFQSLDHIDLLLVDGPRSIHELSRVPALSFFRPWMDSSSLVILDDAFRSHEQAVLATWQRDFEIDVNIQSWTARGQAYVQIRQSQQTE